MNKGHREGNAACFLQRSGQNPSSLPVFSKTNEVLMWEKKQEKWWQYYNINNRENHKEAEEEVER